MAAPTAALGLLVVAAVVAPALEAGEREQLDRGEVLFEPLDPADGRGVAVRAAGLVEASPDEVWPVLRDCEEYQEFLPGVSVSEVERSEPGDALCYTEIRLPWPLPKLVSKNRVEEARLPNGGWTRRWRLEEGSYRRNSGSWELHPWDEDGRRTLAVYRVDFDPETVVPTFLLRRAQRATVPKVFDAIRERVRRQGEVADAS